MSGTDKFMNFFKPGAYLLNSSKRNIQFLGLTAFILGSTMLESGLNNIDFSDFFIHKNSSVVEVIESDNQLKNNALEVVARFPSISERRFDRLKPKTVSQLKTQVNFYNIDLEKVKNDKVFPAVKFDRLPKDLSNVQDVNEKKRLFITSMLPAIIFVNKEIESERRKMLSILEKEESSLSQGEKIWLNNLATKYKSLNDDGSIDFTKLMYRVDKVPTSLALAQAAIESGWGTSRFAREGNALFGQWTWNKEDKGIVPNKRSEGKTHRIKAFDTLEESVRSYIMNLNTHSAYFIMREKRKLKRDQEMPLKGVELAQGLLKYSERGSEYVSEVKDTITYNKFSKFDNLSFVNESTLEKAQKNTKKQKNIILGDVKNDFEDNIVNNQPLWNNVAMDDVSKTLILKLGMKAINFSDYEKFQNSFEKNGSSVSKLSLESDLSFTQVAQKAYVYGLIEANDPRIGANVAHLTPLMNEAISAPYVLAQHKDIAGRNFDGDIKDVVSVLNNVEKSIDAKKDREDFSHVRGLILYMEDEKVSSLKRLTKIAPALEEISVKEFKKGRHDMAMDLASLTEKVVGKVQVDRRRENHLEIS